VALKRTRQDRKFKNRELQIMLQIDHPNVVKLLYYYYEDPIRGSDDVFLNLIIEYIVSQPAARQTSGPLTTLLGVSLRPSTRPTAAIQNKRSSSPRFWSRCTCTKSSGGSTTSTQ